MITIAIHPSEFMHVMRTRLQMTQGELARVVGVNRRTIMRYETNQSPVPPALMARVREMADE